MNDLKQTITSMEVAEMVNKDHNKLLRDIRGYIDQLGQSKIGHTDFFTESTYQSEQNKTLPCFLITKKGCEFIGNKLTGIKGTEFTAKYINRFHDMEDTISNQIALQFRDMSPQLQFMINMEMEQKRQAKEIDNVKEAQKTIAQALGKDIEENFRSWVNRSLSAIAESENYHYIGSPQERHQAIRAESYERLNTKRPCRLEQRVAREQGRAVAAGASQTRIKAINKLTIIEGDKDLKPVYESVIREMLVAYCVALK